MRILITGADGFIGKNLVVRLSELHFDVETIKRDTSRERLKEQLSRTDLVFHLAGANRPVSNEDFKRINTDFTREICNLCEGLKKKPTLVFSSSTQATNNSPYGISKREAEKVLERFQKDTSASVYIYRLPNVFGKWSRPHYNSVVATFCHNIAREKPVEIHESKSQIDLVYIDDLIDSFLHLIERTDQGLHWCSVSPVYQVTVGSLAEKIKRYKEDESKLRVGPVGDHFDRALFSTYLSFLDPQQFAFTVEKHTDSRGDFCEFIKTTDSGQVSFFTARPGATRGGHYHHTKNERFLVIQGEARFRFRDIVSSKTSEITVSAAKPQIVQTIPGWAHDITNIGDSELIVVLWANEIFDRTKPDTISFGVENGESIKSRNSSGDTSRAY